MNFRHGLSGRFLAGAALAALMAAQGPARAEEYKLGEVRISRTTTVSTGASMRASSREDKLLNVNKGGEISTSNSDNGNENFDQGSLSSAATKVTSDFDAKWENFGAFLRVSAFYDPVLNDSDIDPYPLTEAAKKQVGRDQEVLDAFLYGNFDIDLGETALPLQIRLGRQAVNWGESTFIQNGIASATVPIDVTALRRPGSEIKEALVPVAMAYASLGLPANFSVDFFYQFDWERTTIDAPGTLFSTTDVFGPGARGDIGLLGSETGLIPTLSGNPADIIHKGEDIEASNGGQWGVALRYFADDLLGGTEFGLYYVNSHAKVPSGQYQIGVRPAAFDAIYGVTGGGALILGPDLSEFVTFSEIYVEDVKTMGASFSANIGGIAVQGEVSHRIDQPFLLDDVEGVKAVLDATGASACLAGIAPLCGVANNGGAFVTSQIRAAGYESTIDLFRRMDVSQAQGTFTYSFAPTDWATAVLGADSLALVGEAAVMYVHDMPSSSELAFESAGQNGDVAEGGDGFATSTSWGYQLLLRADYLNAFSGVTLSPSLALSHDVEGYSPILAGSFVEDRKAATFSVEALYLNAWKGQVSYTNFFGGGLHNALTDRDFVSVSVSYTF